MKPDASTLRVTDYSLSPHEIEQRIRQLHADGLKVRDIASLMHLHPMLVLRVIGAAR